MITVINVENTDNADYRQPVSERIRFYLGQVRLGVNSSRSEVVTLDDLSAQLTLYNVSRDMSGRHVTCSVAGYDAGDYVVSSQVNIRVAGKYLRLTTS